MNKGLLRSGIGALCALGMMSPAMAQAPGGSCWGKAASGTAKLDTPDGTSGGGMGQHSRSTQAADMNGGFANSNNSFGISFNDGNTTGGTGFGGNNGNGRRGVANQTRTLGVDGPGGGIGNAEHAEANIGASQVLNPVTGVRDGQNALDPSLCQ